MSFVNLMGNDLWSDTDIINRTESMVRSEFSVAEERILSRKISGAASGLYEMTEGDLADLADFQVVVFRAQQAGVEARSDLALLRQVLQYEVALKVLQLPAAEESEMPEQDSAERTGAQAIVDTASPSVLALYALRNPVIESTEEEFAP